jgi:catalase
MGYKPTLTAIRAASLPHSYTEEGNWDIVVNTP